MNEWITDITFGLLFYSVSFQIRLSDRSNWAKRDGKAARGRVFLKGSANPTHPNEIVEILQDCATRDDVLRLIDEMVGHYSIIADIGDEVVAAVDHIRSMPLFYLSDGNGVSDNTNSLMGDVHYSQFHSLFESEYLLTSYVTGKETMLPSVKQVEAGEWISIDKRTGTIENGQHTDYWPVDGSASKSDLKQAINNATQRLCTIADGRPIYVLLSGGIDSRLILCTLVKLGYQPLKALSFGRKNSNDVLTGQQVAEAVNVQWEGVEYNTGTWKNWFQSSESEDYYKWTHNLDSLPGIAPCPAISHLHRQNTVPENAVFVSGQTIASVGEHLPRRSIETREGLIEYIFKNHYNLWRSSQELSRKMRERIDDKLSKTRMEKDLLSAYEEWEWKERQGKFMSQDGLSYAFWGYDWWFPLFDPEVMDVWGSIPLQDRKNKNMMADIMEEYFAEVKENDAVRVSDTNKNATVRSKIMFSVYESPLKRFAWPIYTFYKRLTGIGNHDLAYYGMFGAGQPGKYYSGRETHHSYRVMQATGRMSFNPPDESGLPENCILEESNFDEASQRSLRTKENVYN